LSLYRGAMINIIAGSIAQSVFFAVYNDGKTRYGYDKNNPLSLTTAFISFKAGVVGMTATTPLWVMKTRLALNRDQAEHGVGIIYRTARDMLKKEGPTSFYKGYFVSLILSMHGVVQMVTYETVNSAFNFYSDGQSLGWTNFFVPFLTGGLSKTLA